MKLLETEHPRSSSLDAYRKLVGLDAQKEQLLDTLLTSLCPERVEKWRKEFYCNSFFTLDEILGSPLVVLSGEVGCGKTALAQSVGSVVAEELDMQLISLETPSDIRGEGHVGELSSRITEAFDLAISKVKQYKGGGLLIIDEADDLATSRSQMQAHHEDRAGVNVLIRQIDRLKRQEIRMGVILITNRASALDPAVMRRAGLHLVFRRPCSEVRRTLFSELLGDFVDTSELDELVDLSQKEVPYSHSDIIHRIGRFAVMKCIKENSPFGFEALKDAILHVEPSPTVVEEGYHG